MKIGILATGTAPDNLLAEHGSYATMFVQLFDQVDVPFEFHTFEIHENHFPASLDDYDGWLITGSEFSIHKNLPWMNVLKDLIIRINEKQCALVGVGFGHQMIAEVLGGHVGRAPSGWRLGKEEYRLHSVDKAIVNLPALLAKGSIILNTMHVDQVLVKPKTAQVLMSSSNCKYACLLYDNRILTFQAHPEFSAAYGKGLLSLRKGKVIPWGLAQEGIDVLSQEDQKVDDLLVASWIANFFNQHAA